LAFFNRKEDLNALIMNERWIRTQAKACVSKHLGNGNGAQSILVTINALSDRAANITVDVFVDEIGNNIMASDEPSVCLARKCVQDAIVFTIVGEERDEPQIPEAYLVLASTAIAKHLFLIYGNMK
jgi:hypothetical protein